MSAWKTVIGLEVHAEMETESKMFSSCPVVDSVEAEPNSAVDPLSLGMPGTLPVINRQAMEYGIMVGLALNCEIPPINQFARKNYFYPDLPKGYQISQYDRPLAVNGYIDIVWRRRQQNGSGAPPHMEEGTGKPRHIWAAACRLQPRRRSPCWESSRNGYQQRGRAEGLRAQCCSILR